MPQIFLTYARADRPVAEALAAALEQQGWTVWWDRTRIEGTEFYERVQDEVLKKAACVVVLSSENIGDERLESDDIVRHIFVPAVVDDIPLSGLPHIFFVVDDIPLSGLPHIFFSAHGQEPGEHFDAESLDTLLLEIAKKLEPTAPTSVKPIPAPATRPKDEEIPPPAAQPPKAASRRGWLGGLTTLFSWKRPDKVAAEPQAEPPPRPVEFSAYYPTIVEPEKWSALLAYVHVREARQFVEEDSKARRDASVEYDSAHAEPTQLIKEGAELIFVPELPGCEFDPPHATVTWRGDWQRAEFQTRPDPEDPRYQEDTPITGRVAVYVGPVLVADIGISTTISRRAAEDVPAGQATADPYQAVFVSYAHKDSSIVDLLERAYAVLGLTYLRDVSVLRSGEKWNRKLLEKIEEADIFQLCWSTAASESQYVEQEWRHALGLRRPGPFIRPMYWERPLPPPPDELSDLHFAYYPLES
jgi:hypothetical protein